MEDQRDQTDGSKNAVREQLSALIDGELPSISVREAYSAWRDDASVRDAWHVFSLIGDVMRSADLATTATHDQHFLRDLRARMATEPVVMAPHARPAAATSGGVGSPASPALRATGRSWWGGAAVAAGFVVAAGAMVANRAPPLSGVESVTVAMAPTAIAPRVASASAQTLQTLQTPQALQLSNQLPAATPSAQANTVAVSELQPSTLTPSLELVSDGSVIRDPQLDRYLLAHKQFSGSSVLGAPSGFLRNAAVEFAAR